MWDKTPDRLTGQDDLPTFWIDRWTTEREKRTRFPRQATYWYASPRDKAAKVRSFNREVTELIARRIRTERVLAGVRQVDLAHATGISQPTLSRIECGNRAPTFAEVLRIAIQLGRSMAAFCAPPPRPIEMTGWERRRKLLPYIGRELEEAAWRGEFDEDDPIYD